MLHPPSKGTALGALFIRQFNSMEIDLSSSLSKHSSICQVRRLPRDATRKSMRYLFAPLQPSAGSTWADLLVPQRLGGEVQWVVRARRVADDKSGSKGRTNGGGMAVSCT